MTDVSVSRFRDSFIEKTRAYGVKPATVRWHVKHADAYIQAHGGRRLSAHTILGSGHDIRTVQELLGHADVSTTMIYTHVLNRPDITVTSPIELPVPGGA